MMGWFASHTRLPVYSGRPLRRMPFSSTLLVASRPYLTPVMKSSAPSHGAEDFITGVKYGLDATSNVDEKGILRNGLPEYTGKRVWEANQPIIDLLKSRGALLHAEKTEHSYPHCWRCHNPVIFRATEQWFISMETP